MTKRFWVTTGSIRDFIYYGGLSTVSIAVACIVYISTNGLFV